MRLIHLPRVTIGPLCLFGALGAVSQLNAAPSAEANNAFNEFMSPSGGVNLFSGDVAFGHPLYTLSGRNGLGLTLELNYSSNVRLNVVARNDKAPVDWVGLGWRLGFGQIRCDHNETVTKDDDRYFYVSPKGVSQLILPRGAGFMLEKEPYWKVERTLSTDSVRVLGWTLTDIKGHKFQYGDFQEPGVLRKATRYVLAWAGTAHGDLNFVGEGFAGTPQLHPIQWDISAQVDPSGNSMTYEYEQTLEVLKKGSWTSTVSFTKASYLKSITVTGGGKVDFLRQTKPKGEAYDPYDFYPEPDGFLDPLEEEYLDRIEIKNVSGQKIREFRLGYDVRAFVEKPGYSKRFLKEIREYGIGDLIGTHRFTYAVDHPDSADYPLGAMTSFETPLCGKVEFELARVDVNETNRIYSDYKQVLLTDDFTPHVGNLSDGKEFLVINNAGDKNTLSNQQFYVFHNEDGIWTRKLVKSQADTALPDNLGLTASEFRRVVTGEGFFIIIKGKGSSTQVSIFEWDGKDWRNTNIYNKSVSLAVETTPVGLASRRMAVLFSLLEPETNATLIGSDDNLAAYSYHKQGASWVETRIVGEMGYAYASSTLVGNNFLFRLRDANGYSISKDHEVLVYSWNGSTWKQTKQAKGLPRNDSWSLGKGFIGRIQSVDLDPLPLNSGNHNIEAFSWNGYQWTLVKGGYLDSDNGGAEVVAVGDGFFASRKDKNHSMQLEQWTGEKWIKVRDTKIFGREDFNIFSQLEWDARSYGDYFLTLSPRVESHYVPIPYLQPYLWGIRLKYLRVLYWRSVDKKSKIKVFHKDGSNWLDTNFEALGFPNVEKDPKLGQDFFTHNTLPSNSQVWNGSGWVQQDFARALNPKGIYPTGPNMFAEKIGKSIIMYRKLQNDLVSNLSTFAVVKKNVFDPVRGQTSVYEYEYKPKGARFDMRAGAAKFHRVTVRLPDHGRKEFRFHNGHLDTADHLTTPEAEQSYEMSGNIFMEESYDLFGKKVGRQRHTQTVFRLAGWPGAARSIRLSKSESSLDGVNASSTHEYIDSTGLVRRVEETGSNQRKRITTFLYTYQVAAYSGLNMQPSGRNMLAQVAEKKVYEGNETPANIKQSLVTTWSQWTSTAGQTPGPNQVWGWNASGVSPPAYQAFNHLNQTANSRPWKVLSTVDQRDASGRAVQESNPLGSADCSLFGYRGHYPMASAAHARCSELAILTGDFDDSLGGALDATNGWLRNQVQLSTTVVHFGSASLHVPAGGLGPEKTIPAVASGREYEFSAWVYPLAVSTSSPVVLRVFNSSGAEVLPAQAVFGALQPGSVGGWQRVKRTLPSGSLGTGTVRVLVLAQGAAEFYVDDIRFIPVGTLVTTRYLDPRFFQPVATVSPAGSGVYSEFDGSARLIRTFSEDGSGRKVKSSEMEYHLNGCAFLSEERGTLAKLKVSAGHIPFQKNLRDYGDLWVEPVLEKATLTFAPENRYEQIMVRVNGGAWAPPCCRGQEALEVDLSQATTVVEVRSDTGTPYRVALRKPVDCWALRGNKISAGRGGMPAPLNQGSETWVAFVSQQDSDRIFVKRWNSGTQSWQLVGGAISAGEGASPILRNMQGTYYVAYLDRVTLGTGDTALQVNRAAVKRWSGSAWVPLQGDGLVSKGETSHLAFEASSSALWLAYVGEKSAEEGGLSGGRPAYIRKWNGTTWVPEGDFIPIPEHPLPGVEYRGDSVADGRLSQGDALGISLAVSPSGVPVVGFLGSIRILESGTDSAHTEFSPICLIVKSLVTRGGSTFWGDLVASKGENGEDLGLTHLGDLFPLPGLQRVQLGFVGSTLHAAFTSIPIIPVTGSLDSAFEEGNERVLEVRKYQANALYADSSHWFPLNTALPLEQNIVTPMDNAGDFWFTGQAGIPTLAFVNVYNRDRATVVYHDGVRWKLVGNPAFLPVDASDLNGRLALAATSTGGFLAFRQGGESGEDRTQGVSLATYSGSCPDLGLTQFNILDGNQALPMDWSFRPHLLYLQGGIRQGADSVNLQISPNAATQLSKIWILPSLGATQVWDRLSGQTLPNAFTVPLAPGSNTIEVELVSTDGRHRNRYRVVLRRLPPTAVTGTVRMETPTVPQFDVTRPGIYRVTVPAGKTSFEINTDLAGARTVFINGVPVAENTSIKVPLIPGTNTISLVIIDHNNVRRTYDVVVTVGTASQEVRPLLDSIVPNVNGTYTAVFGYENPNAYVVNLPSGNLNGMRYQGRSAEYLGQTLALDAGTVHGAYSVDFDGSPLTWFLQSRSVTASILQPQLLRVEMRDNGLEDPNVSKPQLRITNVSGGNVSISKISLWISREEVPFQDIAVDPYHLVPSNIALTASAHPGNENLMRIDLAIPGAPSLGPGQGTGVDGPQVGIHFLGHWPGEWDRTNDWSWHGITHAYSLASNVTVYDGPGRLIAGREPTASAATAPLPLSQANVFSFDMGWTWRTTPVEFTLNTSRKTQGSAALQVEGAGHITIANLPMKTVDITGEQARMLVDFYMPNGQPNPSYKGQMQLVAHCPSAGLFNFNIASLGLTSLADGQFSVLSFTLPTAVRNALSGNFRDFQFQWVLDVNQATEQPVLDNMRFAP